MKRTGLVTAVLALVIVALPCAAVSQDQDWPPLYLSVDCMQSTAPDYATVETEIWQVMHQELIDQGKRNSWALYWVMYGDRSTCDYYTVTTYLGLEQLNADPAYGDVFEAVHPDKDLSKAMARTWASRRHVYTELWLMVDSTEIRAHRFAIVNLMNAKDPDAYERMESRVFKAGHQALIDAGHRAGWRVFELVSPSGTSIPYNYSTVDLVNHLNPVPMAEAMMAAHPDRDLEAMHELLGLREQVRSETWALVAATVSPSAE